MSYTTIKSVSQFLVIFFCSTIVGSILLGEVGLTQECGREQSQKQLGLDSRLTKTYLLMGKKGAKFWDDRGGTIVFYGILGLLGLGVCYKSYQAGLEAHAACLSMTDDFDIENFDENYDGFCQELTEQDLLEIDRDKTSRSPETSGENLEPDLGLNDFTKTSDKKVVLSK